MDLKIAESLYLNLELLIKDLNNVSSTIQLLSCNGCGCNSEVNSEDRYGAYGGAYGGATKKDWIAGVLIGSIIVGAISVIAMLIFAFMAEYQRSKEKKFDEKGNPIEHVETSGEKYLTYSFYTFVASIITGVISGFMS